MAIRVLIADDHRLFRAGIRRILASSEDIEVVGEAKDGHEAVELTAALEPTVVLVDIAMPRLGGIDTARRIRENHPQTAVIILSMHEQEDYVLEALRVGAAGYILKSASPQELETAIKAVARGETYLTPTLAKYAVGELRAARAR